MSEVVFNTPFEVSLRLLQAFSIAAEKWLSADMVAVIDFIAIYSDSFGLDVANLNGNSGFKFSEYAARRMIVREAIKQLVLDEYLEVTGAEAGYVYRISKEGLHYARRFKTSYARRYRIAVRAASEHIAGMSEKEAVSLINKTAINALRKGES